MSLQVWLPLNGHIKNYGLSGASATLVNAPVPVNSNRGECYNFNPSNENNQGIELNIPEMPQWIQNEFSIAFWVYHRETSGRSIIFGSFNLNGSYIFNVEKVATNNALRIYMQAKPDQSVTACTLTENEWTHVVITKSKTQLEVFKNGVSVFTRTHAGTDLWGSSDSVKYRIGRDGRSDATALNGMVSDFRIYDHVLSKKEVVELSQGLILHYPLDSPYMTKATNLFSLGSLTHHGSSWTELPEKFMGENVYNNKVTAPNTGNNAGFKITAPINLPSAPTVTTITLSFYKRLNQVYGKNLGGYLTLKNAAGTTQRISWTYNIANWANDSSSLGKWQKITATGTITLTDANQIQYMYVYTDNATGGSCDFSHIQLEYGSVPTAYTDSSRNSFIEDTSGYKRHGIIVSADNGLLSTDTRKGKYSLNLDGTTTEGKRACVKGNLNLAELKTFTVSAFVKLRAWGSQTSGFFCLNNNTYNDNNNYQKSPMHHRDSYFDISALGHTSGASVSTTYKRLLLNNSDLAAGGDWTHVAVTYDGQKATLYLNGVEKRSVSFDAATILQPCKEVCISYSSAGGAQRVTKANWSDFRVYSTALSAAAIKSLADKDAAVDRNSNYYAYDFNEEYDITHNLSTTGILNVDVNRDFKNLYHGKQYSSGKLSIEYDYVTDIFKEYGFNTCTKFTANQTTTEAFKAYSYMMPTSYYKASTLYTFSCYAYVSPDCNANFDMRTGSGTKWQKNYQETTTHISDTRKDQVIKVWGTVKSDTDNELKLLLYPNYNKANVFTTGYILVAGFTLYEGNTPMHPINEGRSDNLILSITPGKNMAAVSGKTYNLTGNFAANADTYCWFNMKKPLEWDKKYRLTFSVSDLPDDGLWGWQLWNNANYQFAINRNGTFAYTFIPRKNLLPADASLSKFLFDDSIRTNPAGTVTFKNFSIVECIASQSHGFFETNKSAIHPEYIEMNNYYEFI